MDHPYESPVFVLTLEVPADEVESLLPSLRAHWQMEPVQFTRPHHASVWLDLYFGDALQAEIAEKLYLAEPRVRSTHVRETGAADWQAAFRGQFRTREIGRRLRVCPVWERETVPDDQRINLWVDPGLSFGTGDHITTSF